MTVSSEQQKRSEPVIRRIVVCLLIAALLPAVCVVEAQETKKSHVDQTADAIYKELNGIDKSLHRKIRETTGRKPATTSLGELKMKYDLSPKNHKCPIY